MPRIYPAKGSDTRFIVALANGPEFRAWLAELELKMSRIVARSVVVEAAQVIADEWKVNALAANGTGRGKGYYGNSIRVTSRSSTFGGGDGVRVIRGATAVAQPRQIGGPDDDEQPYRYAGVLEYGGRLSPAQHSSYIPPQRILTRAFESKQDEAVAKASQIIAKLLVV